MISVDSVRTWVAMFIILISVVGFIAWWGYTQGQPTLEQTTEKLADEVIPFPVKLIQVVVEHLGSSMIAAILIIGIVWFFHGGKKGANISACY